MSDFQEYFKTMVGSMIEDYNQKNPQAGLNNPNPNLLPEFLIQDQAARFLGISKSALYTMTSKNVIPYHKKGRRNYFKKSDLIQWIESGRIRPLSEIREKMR